MHANYDWYNNIAMYMNIYLDGIFKTCKSCYTLDLTNPWNIMLKRMNNFIAHNNGQNNEYINTNADRQLQRPYVGL